MAINTNYVYRSHKFIYNGKSYGICPFGANDPLDMAIFDKYNISFNRENEFIEDVDQYVVTYEIIDNKIYIVSFLIFIGFKETKFIDEDGEECLCEEPAYEEKIDYFFKVNESKKFWANFITGVIEFDDYDFENKIDDGNYNKYCCLIEEGRVLRVDERDKFPNEIIKKYSSLYFKIDPVINNKWIHYLLNEEYKKYLPLKNSDLQNSLFYNNLIRNNTHHNYYKGNLNKNTFDVLNDGSFGSYKDYDGDISDMLDNMGRG